MAAAGSGESLSPALLQLAEDCKQEGNRRFKLRKYRAAIESYTEAVTQHPMMTTAFTNRATCYRMLQEPSNAASDARKAIAIEPTNGKAHYILGAALAESSKLDEGLAELHRAVELLKRGKASGSTVDRCRAEIAKYSKRRIEQSEGEQRLREVMAMETIHNLAHAFVAQRQLAGRDATLSAGGSKGMPEAPDDEQIQSALSVLQTAVDARALEASRREIPDHLFCGISMELMGDPVITPSGHSYERRHITRYLTDHKKEDPKTRETLRVADLRPNLALRESIEAFVKGNPWALEEMAGVADHMKE